MPHGRRRVTAALLFTVGAAVACGVASRPVRVQVEPPSAEVAPGNTITFTASVGGTLGHSVRWSILRGLTVCTDASACGSIDALGVYQAPPKVPLQSGLQILATSVADPSASASSTLQVVPFTVTPDRGPTSGGTRVTIAAAPFTGVPIVLFGSAEATNVQVISDSLLEADVPPGDFGAADVTLQWPDGGETKIAGWHYGATSLKLGGAQIVPACQSSARPADLDLDRDGTTDLVAVSCSGVNRVQLYRNDGAGGLVALSHFIASPAALDEIDADPSNARSMFLKAKTVIYHAFLNSSLNFTGDGNFTIPVPSNTPMQSPTSCQIGADFVPAQIAVIDSANVAVLTGLDETLALVSHQGAAWPVPTVTAPDGSNQFHCLSYDIASMKLGASKAVIVPYANDPNGASGGIEIWRPSAGKLTLSKTALVANFPTSVAIGDFDARNGLDVAVTGKTAQVAVLLNDGAGNLGAPVYTSFTAPSGFAPRSLSAADVDQDGHLDLIARPLNATSDRVYYGSAANDGTFVSPELVLPAAVASPASRMIALAGTSGALSEASAGGGFLEVYGSTAPRAYGPQPIATFGKTAAIVATTGAGYAIASTSSSSLDISGPGAPTLLFCCAKPGPVKAKDVEGDAYPELLIADRSPGGGAYLAHYDAIANWTLDPPLLTGKRVIDIAAGDLDGDGAQDVLLVVNTTSTPVLSVLHQKATGGFDPLVPVPGISATRIAVVGTGPATRVLAADSVSGILSMFEPTSAIGLTLLDAIQVGAQPTDLLPADGDGDGLVDEVLIATQYATAGLLEVDVVPLKEDSFGEIQVYRFDAPGAATFSGCGASVAGCGGGMAVGDVDGDGLPDLLVTLGAPPLSSIAVLRGVDGGRYSDVVERVPVPGAARQLTLLGLDGGLVDALVGNDLGSGVTDELVNDSR